MCADKAVFYVFGKGQGLIRDEEALHIIDEVCFYAPNYGSTPYTIQAATELEFMQVIANMDSDDQEKRAIAEIHLPFFRKESQCDCYDQDCKTPGNTSRTVIWGEFDRLGRITCGTCEGYNGEGTIEEGHPSVHQWNYAVGNADYWMTVGSGKDKETYFPQGRGSRFHSGRARSYAVCRLWQVPALCLGGIQYQQEGEIREVLNMQYKYVCKADAAKPL